MFGRSKKERNTWFGHVLAKIFDWLKIEDEQLLAIVDAISPFFAGLQVVKFTGICDVKATILSARVQPALGRTRPGLLLSQPWLVSFCPSSWS